MNKQIAILATACLVVSLVVAANILPRVLAQVGIGELEKKMQPMQQAKATINATTNQKTTSFPVICNVPSLPQGVKWEDHCELATNQTTFLFTATCNAPNILTRTGTDLEDHCDLKPLR
jgi:hypothetical protein